MEPQDIRPRVLKSKSVDNDVFVIRVHVNVWTAANIIVGLLLIKAVGTNPPEFYQFLRWITPLVAMFGTYVALETYHFGWTLLLAAVCVVHSPIVATHLDRSTWMPLNLATAAVFFAAAVLLRWNACSRPLAKAKDLVEKILIFGVATIAYGFMAHIFLILALLPIAYLASGNEQLVEDWIQFRDAHLGLVGVVTAIAVWLYPCVRYRAQLLHFFRTASERERPQGGSAES